jgi:RadC-like JAB domain
MRFLDREWLRVVLLNVKKQLIKVATVSQGSVYESLAHPREVFKPAIVLSAYSFILVHNHPSGVIPHPVLCRIVVRFFEEWTTSRCGIKQRGLSECFEVGQQLVVWTVSARVAPHRVQSAENRLLQLEIRIQIYLGRVERLVAQPDGD